MNNTECNMQKYKILNEMPANSCEVCYGHKDAKICEYIQTVYKNDREGMTHVQCSVNDYYTSMNWKTINCEQCLGYYNTQMCDSVKRIARKEMKRIKNIESKHESN